MHTSPDEEEEREQQYPIAARNSGTTQLISSHEVGMPRSRACQTGTYSHVPACTFDTSVQLDVLNSPDGNTCLNIPKTNLMTPSSSLNVHLRTQHPMSIDTRQRQQRG